MKITRARREGARGFRPDASIVAAPPPDVQGRSSSTQSVSLEGLDEVLIFGTLVTDDAGLLAALFEV